MIHPELWQQVVSHVQAGISGETLANLLAQWDQAGDPRAAAVSPILIQVCVDEPFTKVFQYATMLGSPEQKQVLESPAGKRWLEQFHAFWHQPAEPEDETPDANVAPSAQAIP